MFWIVFEFVLLYPFMLILVFSQSLSNLQWKKTDFKRFLKVKYQNLKTISFPGSVPNLASVQIIVLVSVSLPVFYSYSCGLVLLLPFLCVLVVAPITVLFLVSVACPVTILLLCLFPFFILALILLLFFSVMFLTLYHFMWMFSAPFPASAPHPYPIPVNDAFSVPILYMIQFLLLSLIFFMSLLLPLLLYLLTFSHWSFPANMLQEFLSRELTTMRHVSFIENLDNLDVYRYSDRQSSKLFTIEIQNNLNYLEMDRMQQNRSNAAIINKAVLSLS